MKKIMKRVLASVLALALCVGTFMVGREYIASASDSTALTEENFKVVGASIRFVNNNTEVDGIRFGVGIKKDTYDALLTSNASTLENIHILIMPSALITDGELNVGETYTKGDITATAADAVLGTDWTAKTYADGTYMVCYAYLYNIDMNYVTTELTARAYLAQDGAEPVYSAAATDRSYMYVAEAALNDLQSESADGYANKVGDNYSPYTAEERNALLSVPYKKQGTWDYVNGNLVQKSDSGNDSLIDRTFKTDEGYVITTSFKTKTIAETKEAGTMGGFNFAYSEENNAFLELGYYSDANQDGALIATVRGFAGSKTNTWPVFAGSKVALDENTWYEFQIITTNRLDTGGNYFDFTVKYRVKDSGAAFADLLSGGLNVTENTTFGNQIKMHGHPGGGDEFSADVAYSKYYQFVAGDQTATYTETDSALTITRARGNTGTEAMVLNASTNNTGSYANFEVSVDIAWDDFSTTDSVAYSGLIFGGFNYKTGGACTLVWFSPKGAYCNEEIPLSNLEDTVENNIRTMITSGEAVTWTVKAVTSGSTTTLSFYVEGHLLGTKAIANTAIFSRGIAYMTRQTVTFSNLTIQ